MYNRYLSFINNEENVSNAKKVLDDQWKPYRDPTEREIKDMLFQNFINEHATRDYNFDNCILLDFPLEFVADLLDYFIPDPYALSWGPTEELAKMIFHLWTKYMNREYNDKDNKTDKRIRNSLQQIKDKLLEFKELDTYDKIVERSKEVNPKNFCHRYYNWHLLAFIPLLGEESMPILMNVTKQRYNDAQDMLILGLAQFEPEGFLSNLADILEYWDKNDNISFCSATGMIAELKMLIKEYHRKGVNVYRNDRIKEILDYHEIFEDDIIKR